MLLIDVVDKISKNKSIILNNLLNDIDIEKIIYNNNFNKDSFKNECLIILIDFFVELINENNEYEANDKLIYFINETTIKMDELFIICKIFKNILLKYFSDSNILFNELEKDTTLKYEFFIELILKKYSKKIEYELLNKEKIITQQKNTLVNQSKSAAMGEMINMITHQWRQPLQSVSILVQKLPLTKIIDGDLSDALLNQVVDEVGIQLEYMSSTIDDFRDFFKTKKPKSNILTSDIINKIDKLFKYMMKIDDIKMNIEIIEDSNLYVYSNEIFQALINIIKNARDELVYKEVSNREINIRVTKNSKFAIIEIEDNAGGIKSENIDKIFDFGFSTKNDNQGTGIGLYISKTIIEENSSGHLSVVNSNLGAVFKVEIPL